VEIENDKNIPFMDVLFTKNNDESLSCQIYRKNTDIERYLQEDSHHHFTKKRGVINTLVTRAN